MPAHADNRPLAFQRAAESLRAVAPRAEIEMVEAPAPHRLAPYALAATADVIVDDDETATGRLVVLYDPDGQVAWEGDWRIVVFAKAEMEPEAAADPMLCDVGWSWLEESLALHDVVPAAFGGTVTRTQSQPYGALAGRAESGQLEVRASWTGLDGAIVPHVNAWLHLLERMAGLEPLVEGVTALRRP